MSQCANCDGEGWVCENHPEVPWCEGDGCCGGAGMPCVCNSPVELYIIGESSIKSDNIKAFQRNA